MSLLCFFKALPVCLLALAACGGNVMVDQLGQSGGATTTVVPDCGELLQDLEAKIAVAQSCDPYYNPPIQCTGSATIKDTCGCTLPANAQDGAAVAAAGQAYAAWTGACGGPNQCKTCPPSSGGDHCDPTQNKCVP